jgi:hypothetical protein
VFEAEAEATGGQMPRSPIVAAATIGRMPRVAAARSR